MLNLSCSRWRSRGCAWWRKPPRPGSWRRVRVRSGTMLWPGRWRTGSRGWKIWRSSRARWAPRPCRTSVPMAWSCRIGLNRSTPSIWPPASRSAWMPRSAALATATPSSSMRRLKHPTAAGCRAEAGVEHPSAQQIFDWICDIRRAKLPDPAVVGNAGSFFKNPTVSPDQCADIIAREPKIVHYPMPDGSIKLAAGWLIDACGWKGKSIGKAGVYEKQALVLVNRGHGADSVTGGEVMTLAKAIQTSVYERFGIRLEPEPVVV